MERTPCRPDDCAGPGEPLGERLVCERHDFGGRDLDVTVQIPDQVRDSRGFCHAAWLDDQHVLLGRRDHERSLSILVDDLSWVKNRARGQLQRQHGSI
jgi:hypothetical protein